jgi:hypothetical protein
MDANFMLETGLGALSPQRKAEMVKAESKNGLAPVVGFPNFSFSLAPPSPCVMVYDAPE